MERGSGVLSLVVAFVTAVDGVRLSGDVVRAELSGRLPGYMVPNRVVVLDAIPLTTSGKVDRRALAEVSLDQVGVVEVDSEVEQLVCDVFSEVLQCGPVGRSDDFFELGGHSLAALKVARLLSESGWKLSPAVVLKNPQPVAIAKWLERNTIRVTSDRVGGAGALTQHVNYPLNLYNSTLAVMLGNERGRLKYQIPLVVRWSDIQARNQSLGRLRAALKQGNLAILEQRYALGGNRSQTLVAGPVHSTHWTGSNLDEQAIHKICRAFAATNEVPALTMLTVDEPDQSQFSAVLVFSHLYLDDYSVRWIFTNFLAGSSADGPAAAPAPLDSYCAFLPASDLPEFVGSQYAQALEDSIRQSDLELPTTQEVSSDERVSRTIVVSMSAKQAQAVANPAHLGNSTTFVLLNVAIRIAIASKFGSATFPVGTAVSLRESHTITADTRENLGYALNTVLLPQTVDIAKSVSDVVAETQAGVVDALDYSTVPYSTVAAALYRSGAFTSNSGVDVWAQLTEKWHFDPDSQITSAGLADNGYPKFALTYFLEMSHGLPTRLMLQYDSTRCSESTARTLAEFTVMCMQLIAECKPAVPIRELIWTENV